MNRMNVYGRDELRRLAINNAYKPREGVQDQENSIRQKKICEIYSGAMGEIETPQGVVIEKNIKSLSEK